MRPITLRVNGRSHTVDVEPATPLLYVLRNDLGLRGPRFGCGLGQCGACTVIVDGEAVRSCVRQTGSVEGAEITTLEGLARDGRLHPLQQAWIDEQVPQCGFCQNGQILTAKVLLDKNPRPSDADIRQAMSRTLCRCMTYYRVQAAIRRAAGGRARPGGRRRREAPHEPLHRRPAAHRRRRAALPRHPPDVPGAVGAAGRRAWARCPTHCRSRRRPGSRRRRRSVSRSRLPAARLVDHRSAPTTPRRSSSARPTSARAPARRSGS